MDPRLEQESNPDVLREVVRSVVLENQRLSAALRDALTRLAKLTGTAQAALFTEVQLLQERLNDANRRLFGESSEKREHTTSEAEAAETSAPPPKKRGHGPAPQTELPRFEIQHTVAPQDAVCTSCGGEMQVWEGQEETSEEVTSIERHFVVHVHTRQKLRCSCGGCIKVADAPLKLREAGRYSVDFAIEVAVSKYLDHLPLERQVRIMAREGLTVESQTLWDQVEALATWMQPAWKRLGEFQREQPLLHVDETPWRLTERQSPAKRWWAWVSRSDSGVYFELKDTRSAKGAQSLLLGYCGLVMSDGYAAYKAIHRETLLAKGTTFQHAHCWAHVRRKFVELEESFPAESKEALRQLGALFAIERKVPESRVDADSLAARLALRRERSAPLVHAFGRWIASLTPLPQSGLAKAVQYTENLWLGLNVFLTQPRVPLSNNAAERAVRGPVIGRKNYYGSRSQRGCQVAAIFYSLLESAKLCGLEPKAYLRGAVAEALAGRVIRLPHEVRAARL